ncbi:MAG: LexA family protein [Sporolactobacillus sp.]
MNNSEALDIFSNNFKLLRESRGMTTTEIASRLGVSQSTISTWENGIKLPRADALDKITKFFNVSLAMLMSKTNIKKSDLDVKIPLYGDIAAGALSTLAGVTKDDVEHIQVPVQFLNGHSAERDIFALHVNGESMNKIIPNRAYVVCLPIDKSDLAEGQIVIFSHDGEYSMKRFLNDEDDEVLIFRPESYDAKFRDIVVHYDTMQDLKIYAKVIGYYVNLEK